MDNFFGANSILATMENVANLILGALQEKPCLENRKRKTDKECWKYR